MSARRKRNKLGNKNNNDTSSSESEYSKTLEIITRLSQKYLGPGGKTSKKKTAREECEYDGDAENTTEGSESGASCSASSSASASSAYDFDEVDDTDELSGQSKKKTRNYSKSKGQIKTKQEPVVKTVEKSKSKEKSKPKNTEQAKNVQTKKDKKQTKNSPKLNLDIPMDLSDKTPSVCLKKLDKEDIDSCKRQLRKRRFDSSNTTDTSISQDKVLKTISPENKITDMDCTNNSPEIVYASVKSTKNPSTAVNSSKEMKKRVVTKVINNDSGICATPPVCVKMLSKEKISKQKGPKGSLKSPSLRKMPILQAKDTSTPSTETRLRSSARKKGNTSCFGFEETVPPAIPEISPVQKVDPITPLSDYASMDPIPKISFDDTATSIHKESQPFQLFSMDDDEDFSFNKSSSKSYKVSKKRQVKKKLTPNPKIDKMLNEMNSKFEEIEKFELSIE